jgi:hypothetical protein
MTTATPTAPNPNKPARVKLETKKERDKKARKEISREARTLARKKTYDSKRKQLAPNTRANLKTVAAWNPNEPLTLEVISNRFGVTKDQALRLLTEILRGSTSPAQTDQARTVEGNRINELRETHWTKAVTGDIPASTMWLRLTDRYARLHGLDQPIKLTIELEQRQRIIESTRTLILILDRADLDETSRLKVLKAINQATSATSTDTTHAERLN